MLTKLSIRNFKRFPAVDIDLSQAVVFIGPNNSGKTTALQALALWEAGCKQWLVKRAGAGKKDAAKAITIGRKDLVYLPLPASNALWKDLRVREGFREDDKTKTKSILIEVVVHGADGTGEWACGLEFEYVSEEFFYCRPLRLDDTDKPQRMPVPSEQIEAVRLAFLPPMSGLLMVEPLLQPGRINVLLGGGHSGEVLRNLCYSVFEKRDGGWDQIVASMFTMFGVTLNSPVFVPALGTIEMDYAQAAGQKLPLTSAGLGMQQTLLLLAYLHLNQKSVLLLDEPDAHLEILRQRQIYQLLTDMARRNGSQIVCASHSEVVLNEAVNRDTVIAFVGKPHVVSGNQGSQALKALRDIGFEHYVQAEQSGWVLYLEGSTDLAILQAWARKLKHKAEAVLSKPFVHYLNTNLPSIARAHFNAVKEANPDLIGIAVFDRLEVLPQGTQEGLTDTQWTKREIENFFADSKVLLAFARGPAQEDLIETSESEGRALAMEEAISEVQKAFEVLGEDLWSSDRKASEQVLPQIFKRYFEKTRDIRVPEKGAYFTLIEYQDPTTINAEIREKLDLIYGVAIAAKSHDK